MRNLKKLYLITEDLTEDVLMNLPEKMRTYMIASTTDVNLNNLDQYSRRVNVEIKNISESTNQSNIENHVMEVFKSIGVKVQSYDLVAVHHLGKYVQGKNRNVIVRFIYRKNAFAFLRNSKNLAVSNSPEYKNYSLLRTCAPLIKKCTIIYIVLKRKIR